MKTRSLLSAIAGVALVVSAANAAPPSATAQATAQPKSVDHYMKNPGERKAMLNRCRQDPHFRASLDCQNALDAEIAHMNSTGGASPGGLSMQPDHPWLRRN